MSHRRLFYCLLVSALPLLSCNYDENDYLIGPETVNDWLTFESVTGDSTLPADGLAILELVATIDPGSDADRRTIVFSTSAGTLIGGTSVSGTKEIVATAEGRAFIQLQSSVQEETAVVRASSKSVPSLNRELMIRFVRPLP